MLDAGQHMANYQTLQSTTDGLNLFYCPHLQTDGGKDGCHFLCIVRQRDVTFKPIVRYIHNLLGRFGIYAMFFSPRHAPLQNLFIARLL